MTIHKQRPVRNGVGASVTTLPNHGPWPTVLAYLLERFPAIPESEWRRRESDGGVFDVNGDTLDLDRAFKGQLKLFYFRHLQSEIDVPFAHRIVFQDRHLLVADKPHFLSTIPAGRHVQQTLLVRLKRETGIDSLTPMHRIDRDTAGLVVFVKNPEERGAYQTLFHTHAINKRYFAVAPFHRTLEFPQRVRVHLREGEHFMQMQVVDDAVPNSESLVELIDIDSDSGLARYRLTPITGKKHQLRAHMAHLGIPIHNDSIYPVFDPPAPDDFSKPLQLLAHSIAFIDPITGEQRRFESTLRLKSLFS